MLIRIRTALIALVTMWAVLTSGLSAPAGAQSEVENAPDPYIHKAVGVAFPEQISGFKRGQVTEFDAQGNDAAISYNPTDLAGEVSLYVYPLGDLACDEQFAGAHEAVVQRKGSVLGEQAVFSIPAFSGATQLSRSYRIPAGGYGYDHPALVSFLWVGCPVGGDWIVKYRGSFLESDAMKLFGIEQKLFGALDWSPLVGR